jgi:spore maturation protein CgeB
VRLVFFLHSVASDWNHGNAHFVRGLLDGLARRGHAVTSAEPVAGWSLANLVADAGAGPIVRFARAFPDIGVENYDLAGDLRGRLREIVAGADAVVVHEWTDPVVVGLLAQERRGSGCALLFHDTHHRAVSRPGELAELGLDAYDGVLAFGESLARIYRRELGVRRAWTFHEAADTRRFRPLQREQTDDVLWIGNWGDEERSSELRSYFLESARALPALRFAAHGARYPAEALRELAGAGIEFRGWAPSLDVPELFARARITLHIPRRLYVERLPGIPTIRVFEALACGVPLVSTPWHDSEGLFRDGDFVPVRDPAGMRHALARLAADPDARAAQAERGLETVLARHTCDHRADELLGILAELGREGA